MTITFRCEHCRRDVKAPQQAAGKRGKCPFCGQSSYIPAPIEVDDLPDLAPIDEEEERREKESVRALRQQEHDLIAETGGDAPVPLDQREDLVAEDLHHFVVNYCLDMFNGKLGRAGSHAQKLKEFGQTGADALKDFQAGKAAEPALGDIPEPVLQGFLKQLAEELL